MLQNRAWPWEAHGGCPLLACPHLSDCGTPEVTGSPRALCPECCLHLPLPLFFLLPKTLGPTWVCVQLRPPCPVVPIGILVHRSVPPAATLGQGAPHLSWGPLPPQSLGDCAHQKKSGKKWKCCSRALPNRTVPLAHQAAGPLTVSPFLLPSELGAGLLGSTVSSVPAEDSRGPPRKSQGPPG